MSLSVLVQCPHCNAQGNLADPALFGQAISCPVCQQTFVAPTPADQTPPSPPFSDQPPPVPVDAAAMEPIAAVPPTPDMTVIAPSAGSPVAAEWPPQPMETAGAVSIAAPLVAEAVADGAAATSVPAVIDPAVVAAAPVAPVLVSPVPVSPVLVGAVEVINPSIAEVVDSTLTQQPVAVQSMPVAVAVPVAAVSMPLPQADAPGAAPIAPPPAAGMWPVGTAPLEIIPPVTGDFLVAERPAMEGPTPAFMAPLPPPGAEEVGFAESLPEPVARGAVKPHKPPSQMMVRVVVGSITAIVLFATVMFLMGDPMRGRKPKLKGPVEENPIAGKGAPPGESIENIFDRINATSKPNDKKGNP